MSQVILLKHTDVLVLRESRCYCLDKKKNPHSKFSKHTAYWRVTTGSAVASFMEKFQSRVESLP